MIIEDRTLISREEQIDMLVTMIQDTIGKQEYWAAYGGTVSSVREFHGQLIVKTTPVQHRALRDLLELIRKSRRK